MAGYFFGCPHCRAKLETTDASRAGRTVTCPKCEQSLIIPPPPKMGVSLSQSGELAPRPAGEDASQVVVSSDPGFKRPMSPPKAYSENESLPTPSSAGFERLSPSESLDTTPSHTLDARDNVEGYSFSLPENGAEVAPKLPKAKKVRPPKPEDIDPPSPWEDPKNQLAALVGAVVLVAGFTAWMRSGGDDKDKKSAPQVAAPAAPVTPPTIAPAAPALPPGIEPGTGAGSGAPALPGSVKGLPGATTAPAAVPPPAGASLPGAVPNVLLEGPDTGSGEAPRLLPGSTPNVVPPPDAKEQPNAKPALPGDSE